MPACGSRMAPLALGVCCNLKCNQHNNLSVKGTKKGPSLCLADGEVSCLAKGIWAKYYGLGLTLWHLCALLPCVAEPHRASKETFIWGWASLKPPVIAQWGLCTLAFVFTQLWSFGHTKFSTWVPSSVFTAEEIGNNPLLQPQALSGNLILLFNFTGNKFPSWREISSCEREENVSVRHLTSGRTMIQRGRSLILCFKKPSNSPGKGPLTLQGCRVNHENVSCRLSHWTPAPLFNSHLLWK